MSKKNMNLAQTAYMGQGAIVISNINLQDDGRLVLVNKTKTKAPIGAKVNIDNLGDNMFNFYFPSKTTLENFIKLLQQINEEWR